METVSVDAAEIAKNVRLNQSDAIARIVREMKKIANVDVRLDEWADYVSLSKSELISAFRKLTGIPPMAFHNAEKLEIAKQLLVFENMPVTEVCFEIGFESLGSFVSKFTNCVGIPPGNYARAMRNSGFVSAFTSAVSHAVHAPTESGRQVELVLPGGPNILCFVAAVFRKPNPCGYPFDWRFLPPFRRSTRIASLRMGYCLVASCPTRPDLKELVNYRPALVGRQALGTSQTELQIKMRAPSVFDPPVTLAVPALFSRESTNL